MTRTFSRSPNAGSATTIVVLLAMACAVSSVAPAGAGHLVEGRVKTVDAKAMRAMAAAMVAVARDLVGGQPMPASVANPATVVSTVPSSTSVGLVGCRPSRPATSATLQLGARRLDLPPPRV